MDPLQPITPRPTLPVIERAAAIRRVQREREDAQAGERERRRQPGDGRSDDETDGEDDGHPHVDITV